MSKIRTCEVCGMRSSVKVKYVVNPYALEIDGETIKMWSCDDCFQQLCDDI